MRRLAMMAALGAVLVAAPARADLVVSISKAQQRLSVLVDGKEAYRWPISTGRRGYSTPVGAYRPTRLERHWYSRKYQMAPMPWSVFFHRGYAVHGTTEVATLGRPASHGCVRLRPDNASILFAMVKRYGARNTRFVVMNGPLPAAPRPMNEPMAKLALLDLDDAGQPAAPVKHDTEKKTEQQLSAKTFNEKAFSEKAHNVREEAEVAAPQPAVRTRLASLEQMSVSVGSEARVLREREAWLRAIDRKYGITQ